MISKQFSEQELIELIKKDQHYLGYVYMETKNYCIKFLRNLNRKSIVNDSELDDIYHDALLVLYEKIIDGNFILKASFQTYLNSVCRLQLLNKFKAYQKDLKLVHILKGDRQKYDDTITDILEPIPDKNEKEFSALERAMITLKKTGGKCYELLTMFWYQKKSMNEIADHFGYTNAANAKNQKSKCQKRLQKEALKFWNT